MPRLSRLRLVSIGHPDMRFDDLTLDFQGANGRSDNAVLWLRNGGGKTSLLSLFFALVRPHSREFLRDKSSLEDYVSESDHSAIVAEWEQDDNSGTLFENTSSHLITGVFIEREKSGQTVATTGARPLRRLFFAARTWHDEPRLSLQGLPLYVSRGNKMQRRTLVEFRQEWQALGKDYPGAQTRETENQNEWASILAERHLDSELFRCQLRMNRFEGGAFDLFRLNNMDQYVDLFLELIFSGHNGAQLAGNLETYGDALRNGASYVLERDLTTGMIERLEPLRILTEERGQIQKQITHAIGQQKRLYDWILTRQSSTKGEILQHELLAERAVEAAKHARERERKHTQNARQLRLYAAILQARVALLQVHNSAAELKAAQREWDIWFAAVPLRNALREQAEAEGFERALAGETLEHAPLLLELQAVAVTFASALTHRIQSLRTEQAKCREREGQARKRAQAAHEKVSRCKTSIAELEQRATHLRQQLDQAEELRMRLHVFGALNSGETVQVARERWCTRIVEIRVALNGLETVWQDHIVELQTTRQAIEDVLRETSQAELESSAIEERVKVAELERDALAHDPYLTRYLEVISLESESLYSLDVAETIRGWLYTTQDEVLVRLSGLKRDQHLIEALSATDLLPPERDVDIVLNLLQQEGLSVWPGWIVVATSITETKRREFIAAAPEIARGVVVRDSHFERSVTIMQSARSLLETPVTLVARSAVDDYIDSLATDPGTMHSSIPSNRRVFGPTGEAYFDKEAGRIERIQLEQNVTERDKQLSASRANLEGLQTVWARLRRYLECYPQNWWQQQYHHKDGLERRLRGFHEQQVDLAAKERYLLQSMNQTQADRDQLYEETIVTRGFVTRIEEYLVIYPDAAILEEQWRDAFHQANIERAEIPNYQQQATEYELEADEQSRCSHEYGETAKSEEAKLNNISYLESKNVRAEPGNTPTIEREYKRLELLYNTKAEMSALRVLSQDANRRAQEAWSKFYNSLRNGLDEVTVRQSLQGLTDYADLEAHFRTTNERCQRATSNKERNEEYERQARRQLDQLGYSGDINEIEIPKDAMQESLTNEAEAQESTANKQARFAETQDQEAQQAHRNKAEADQELLARNRDLARLEQLRQLYAAYPDLIDAQESQEPCAWHPPKDADIDRHIDSLHEDLARLGTEEQRTRRERELRAQSLREWMTEARFEFGKFSWLSKYKPLSAEGIEHHAASLQDELQTRAINLAGKIEEAEKDRTLLLNDVLLDAEHGVQRLKDLANRSKLPESLRTFADRPFLRIHLQLPVEKRERQARIGRLVDELVNANKPVDGLELVQSAVRKLAGPIRIEALFPDVNTDRVKYSPLTEVGAWSGGQRLTFAILLYCTLARFRSASQSTYIRPTGVLLLDNPLGSVSRPQFLDLQREVAKACGVQLIYATGVEDLEAIRYFAVPIRLRNERTDLRTGHRVVELDKATVLSARLILPSGDAIPTNSAESSE